MKTTLSLVIVLAVTSTVLITSCKNDDDSQTISPNYCSDVIQNNGETGVDCGGSCVPCANAFTYSLPFYIQFKENGGSFTYFQDDTPDYTSYLISGSTYYYETDFSPLFNSTHGFGIKYSGAPTSLVGKSFSFNYNNPLAAKMIFFDSNGNEVRTSINVSDQTGSNCYIESVILVSTDTIFGGVISKIYAAKGNFNCKISKSDGSNQSTLTYGKFSIRLEHLQ